MPARFQHTVLEQVFEIAELAHLTEAERSAYETSLKHYRDMINVVDTARMEGEAIGEAKGEVKGERNAELKIAQNMLVQNFIYEQIEKLTGLTLEEVRSLEHSTQPKSDQGEVQ